MREGSRNSARSAARRSGSGLIRRAWAITRLQEGHFVVGEDPLAAGVGEKDAERARRGGDDHARARQHAVKVAEVIRFEARLLLQVFE